MRTAPSVRLAAMAALTLVLGSATTVPMTAAGEVGAPLAQVAVPVQQVLDPVAFALCTAEGPAAVQKCEVIGNPPTYQVPPGRRLVVEQVSGDCGTDYDPGAPLLIKIVAQTKGVVLGHEIIGVTRSDAAGGRIPLTLTRIYADPHSTLTIDLTGIPAVEGRFCRATFSGQLVKP